MNSSIHTHTREREISNSTADNSEVVKKELGISAVSSLLSFTQC